MDLAMATRSVFMLPTTTIGFWLDTWAPLRSAEALDQLR
jgi:hypothetical protein